MIRTLFRGLTMACAVCGTRGLFRGWRHQLDRCPRCGLTFERAAGHWLGAIAANTVLSAMAVIAVLVVQLVRTWPDTNSLDLFIVIIPIGLIAPLLLFPVSRTLWGALDVLVSPPTDEELSADYVSSGRT